MNWKDWIPISLNLHFRAETSHWCSKSEKLSGMTAQEWINISAPLLDEGGKDNIYAIGPIFSINCDWIGHVVEIEKY